MVGEEMEVAVVVEEVAVEVVVGQPVELSCRLMAWSVK